MPALVLLIPVNLDELLENRNATSYASGSKASAVMEVAVLKGKNR